MDLSEVDTRKAAESLFAGSEQSEYEEIQTVAELPGVDQKIAAILKDSGIDDIEQFMAAVKAGTAQKIEGITDADIEAINKIISENVEFEEEPSEQPAQTEAPAQTEQPAAPAGEEQEEYFCPECGAKITLDMTRCPKCGVEFEFEEDEGK